MTNSSPRKTEPKVYARIQAKKAREKKRRQGFLKILGLILALLLIYALAPIFRVHSSVIRGVYQADLAKIEKAVKAQEGKHRLLASHQAIRQAALQDPFVEDVLCKTTLGGLLDVTIKEYPADFALVHGDGYPIIHRSGRVLGTLKNLPAASLILKDNTPLLPPGKVMYPEGDKKRVLNEFMTLKEKNTSSVQFKSLDITDIKDLKVESGDWTIELGPADQLGDKLNKAINIIKAYQAKGMAPGIINLKYNTDPVVRPKEATNGNP